MWKSLLDRLTYALVGFVVGALAAIPLWIVMHAAKVSDPTSTLFEPGFVRWVKVVGTVFAVLGFLIKDHAGSVIGVLLDGAFKAAGGETGGNREAPNWLVVVFVVGVALLVYVLHRS